MESYLENKDKEPFIVLISGKMRHGKDTLALFLTKEMYYDHRSFIILHYADYLKYICKQIYKWNGEKDEEGRTLLQTVGENFRKIDKDFWVKQTISLIKAIGKDYDYILIPDVRYINEIEIPKEEFKDNIITIRVHRAETEEGTQEQKAHPSETSLDNYDFDLVVLNDEIEEFRRKSADVYDEIKIKQGRIPRIL